MTKSHRANRKFECVCLLLTVALFVALALTGMGWGLPSTRYDDLLFGGSPPWPGNKIIALADATERWGANRGADVDADPIRPTDFEGPVPLTANERDVAKIYLRYRLYTHQPDEMITMMALAEMNPGQWQFDPKLYQYGGLFLYPVGLLLKACDLLGLIRVHGDLAFYLDRPEEFGKFYLVARGYAAAWGVVGVLVVASIARRLAGRGAAVCAAFLFTLLPVVVCMSHEGKPHLSGAVLMLSAVLLAMRYVAMTPHPASRPLDCRCSNRDFLAMCALCGGAVGMVLSSAPIVALIPLVAWMGRWRGLRRVDIAGNFGHESPRGLKPAVQMIGAGANGSGRSTPWGRMAAGLCLCAVVYLVTNPYIAINALTNRAVLASNFGNSLAMYEVRRIAEGFVRVLALTIEGATLPVLVLGALAGGVALARRRREAWPLIASAGLFFLQFALIGAGKPGEYGRFGVFPNSILAIGTACVLCGGRLRRENRVHEGRTEDRRRWLRVTRVVGIGLTGIWLAYGGGRYLYGFHADTTNQNTRVEAARYLRQRLDEARARSESLCVLVPADPAPYCFPPADFRHLDLRLQPDAGGHSAGQAKGSLVVRSVDRHPVNENAHPLRMSLRRMMGDETVISWANKPILIE